MMEVFTDIAQGTEDWYAVRLGLPTASEFHHITAKKGPRGGTSHKEYKGRTTYLWKLAGERITGRLMDSYTNFSMDRGKGNEGDARNLYEFLRDVEVEQVGFIRNGNCGCSPDGLIDAGGMFENKDAAAHVQIERLLKNQLPPEHKAQCQGNLMVAEREWIDFMSHCRDMPPLIVRVYRDEDYIKALRSDVDQFVDELNELVDRIRRM